MPTPVDHGHNFQGIHMHGHPLGVECKGCGRRRLVAGEKLGAYTGNMKVLAGLRFVCSACGSRDWAGWLFITKAEADAFPGNGAGPAI
jgi:DNA-directed RNA polymerase subunit RPC12/RpoP